jgi:hypothetical protein
MMANGFIGPQQVIRHILILLILIIIINLDEIVEDTLDTSHVTHTLTWTKSLKILSILASLAPSSTTIMELHGSTDPSKTCCVCHVTSVTIME